MLSMATEIGSRSTSSTIDLYFRKRNGCSFGRPVPTRSQIRRFSKSHMFVSPPTFRIIRRTAESVILSGSEKNICHRTNFTTFSIVFLGNLSSSRARFVTRAPTTSWPWNVQSFFSSLHRLVSGFEISWNKAAKRISNDHFLSAACCVARSKCSKTSKLWA